MKKRFDFLKPWMILGLLSLFIAKDVFAGTSIYPFSIRAQCSGQYDIKMIAAPNLEPVYIDSLQAVSKIMKVDSVINPQTILHTGTLFCINNRYKPFSTNVTIPLSSILCPSGNSACPSGYNITTSASCPNGKWSTIKYLSRTIALTYPDYDADSSTFSSSYAYLDIPSDGEVQAAYLYWTGMKQGSDTINPTIMAFTPTSSYIGSGDVYRTGVTKTDDYKTIKLKCPGMTSYSDVTAIQTYENTVTMGGNSYICVGDVTDIVKGKTAGKYWTANIRTYPADYYAGSSSGWTMIVIYKSSTSSTRTLALYDGIGSVQGASDYLDFTLSGITAPSTSNFKSYLGYAVLDGENSASELIGSSNFALTPKVTQLDGTNIANNSAAECIQFTANGGAPTVYLNPFYGDTLRWYSRNGQPESTSRLDIVNACKIPIYNDSTWGYGFDGASSSRITTYNEIINTNGNEIDRKPSGRYTMGYDSHMMLLPKTAIVSGTTSATMRIYAGEQGGATPFMAFISIQTDSSTTTGYDLTNKDSEVQIYLKGKVLNVDGLTRNGNAEIVDLSGKVCQKYSLQAGIKNILKLDVAQGVYVVRVVAGKSTTTEKIVVK